MMGMLKPEVDCTRQIGQKSIKFVMTFPHSHCRDNGQVTPTMHKENDHTIVFQYDCAPPQINKAYRSTTYPMAIG
jgi:hypothetical protein